MGNVLYYYSKCKTETREQWSRLKERKYCMILAQAIIEVLKKHSSKEKTQSTHPLKVTEIVKYLKEDFPEMERDGIITISDKTVRTALNHIVVSEENLDEKDRTICYTIHEKKDNSEYKTDYWTPKSISDLELKFLIDSVMYSKIFTSDMAHDFARRIQALSGKNLENITKYANASFGKQRLNIDVDILDNIQKIIRADKENVFLSFDLNIYDVDEKQHKIRLKKKNHHVVKVLKVILSEGRYLLLARYKGSKKIYHFWIDLMSNLVLGEKVQDKVDVKEFEQNFWRSGYVLQHPFMMGGKEKRYKLRVNREYMTRVVDAFSYGIEVIPGTETDKTVDIRVKTSAEGLKRWLLLQYDAAELIEPDEKMEMMMAEAVESLYAKYHKKGIDV